MTGYPEPPPAGSETDTLVGSLERQRATFAYKCADLTAEQLRVSVGASAVTLGGLLKHLAYMEDVNFTWDLAGHELPSPWAELPEEGRGELVWRSAADDDAPTLYRLWADAVSTGPVPCCARCWRRAGPARPTGPGAASAACGACSWTSSRSTPGTPGTPT